MESINIKHKVHTCLGTYGYVVCYDNQTVTLNIASMKEPKHIKVERRRIVSSTDELQESCDWYQEELDKKIRERLKEARPDKSLSSAWRVIMGSSAEQIF